MSEIIIRAMTEADIDEAIHLWQCSFHAGFSASFDTKEVLIRYLNRNPFLSTVAATNDNKIVGTLLCGHDGRRASIYHTTVNPTYRNLGIARKMEERALQELKKIGINSGFLFINIHNKGSKEFWTSLGWVVIEDVRYLYKSF